jgi:D-aspartate ligase
VRGAEPSRSARRRPEGAVVLGSDYRALGVVRSLGRRGIPVVVVSHGDDRLAARSKYARRAVELPEGGPQPQVDFLLRLASREGLWGWALIPSADESAALVARNADALGERYTLTTPSWEVMRWAYDKRLTHELANRVGVEHPVTAYPRSRDEIGALPVEFPAIIKPAIKEDFNPLTAAKAWRVDSPESLLERYDEACSLVDPSVLMVQELVPGNGVSQLSYAALCEDGRSLASVVARRTRQYPMDFGRASTYVETIEDPEVVDRAERLLADLRWTGLVEVEFKRDSRDGAYKLLDINPRVWGWHTLCGRVGVDFPYLLWRSVRGESVPAVRSRPGVGWMRMTTDLPTVLKEIRRRRMSVREYLGTLRGPRESAIFAKDDPVPGLVEVPMLAATLVRRLARGSAV